MSRDKKPTLPTAGNGSKDPSHCTSDCPCPNMEIEINNTAVTDDDWLILRCAEMLNCRIRALGSPPLDTTVVLTNHDGRLRFNNATDATTSLVLPSDGSWVGFQIFGNTVSNAVGDAVIEAHCYSATEPVQARKAATVVAMELDGLLQPNGAAVELPNVNDLSLLPVADRIAHRSIKFKFTPVGITQGKVVQWTFLHSGISGGVLVAGVERGVMTAAHNAHLEVEPGFSFNAATLQSTIDNAGNVAVRVNLPPIAFNRGRLSVNFLDRPLCLKEVDFEVPAVVVIDPGHGGVGSVGGSDGNHAVSPSGVLEKNMTLDLSQLVSAALLAAVPRRNIQVVLTRNADVNLSLAARANFARDNSADVFLSIHMNGFNHVAHGPSSHIRPAGNDQVNHAEDEAFGTRVANEVLAVFPDTDRAHNVVDQVLGILRDTSLGNVAAFHKTRACLFELDFIDVPAVDVRLNTGPNAAANRQTTANAIRDAIIDDLLNQP